MRHSGLLLLVPLAFSGVAGLAASGPAAIKAAAPDPLNPVYDQVEGPFRAEVSGRDEAGDPSPAYSDAERRQLEVEGKELFFSRTAWGQRPSKGPLVKDQVLSCATCHVPPAFTDGLTHLVGPVAAREVARRQTPSLYGLSGSAPFGWDGRNPTSGHQSRGAITSPLEMHATREPTRRELDALDAFQRSLTLRPPRPGRDYDPVRAERGERLFTTPRPVVDPTGEFPAGEKVACATCHPAPSFTDNQAHRQVVVTGDPLFDPGEVRPDGSIAGFHTPSLLGARLSAPFFHDGAAGDPTAPGNYFSGGLGPRSLDAEVGAFGISAARRALLDNVLPFYNGPRFGFRFTDDELRDLAEYVLSL